MTWSRSPSEALQQLYHMKNSRTPALGVANIHPIRHVQHITLQSITHEVTPLLPFHMTPHDRPTPVCIVLSTVTS